MLAGGGGMSLPPLLLLLPPSLLVFQALAAGRGRVRHPPVSVGGACKAERGRRHSGQQRGAAENAGKRLTSDGLRDEIVVSTEPTVCDETHRGRHG